MGREELVGSSGAFMDRMIEGSGAGRVGTPDDIAAVAEFLASPAAAFVTGTDVLVDGGAVAGFLWPQARPSHGLRPLRTPRTGSFAVSAARARPERHQRTR